MTTVRTKHAIEKIRKAQETALQATGAFLQDATADNTVRITGLLANSWNWRTSKDRGRFGDMPTTDTKLTLGEDERVSDPGKDTVRIGSALVYAPSYNRKRAVLERTVDTEQNRLKGLAEKAFKKEIGT